MTFLAPTGPLPEVTCAECRSPMVLRTAQRGPQVGRRFWGCSRYPACAATHGAHADGRPLGVPGDAATKRARVDAHAVFDRLWRAGHVSTRPDAYRWLRTAMGLSEAEGHIGRFTVGQCEELIARVRLFTCPEGAVGEEMLELRRLADEAIARMRRARVARIAIEAALGRSYVDPRMLFRDELAALLAAEFTARSG